MKVLLHIKRHFWKYFLLLVIFMNVIAAFHAYRFVHFSAEGKVRTKKPEELTLGEKIVVLFTGISNPRPENEYQPSVDYQTILLEKSRKTELWYIPVENSKGCVVVGHGYLGSKSKMLDRAMMFREMGYNTVLLDFLGSGGSESDFTSIGYFESEQIRDVVNYLYVKGEENIILYGSSMGSVAMMKAQHESDLPITGMILECPFSTMRRTVANRFYEMGLPAFPMSDLLVFWGGVFGEFNAFDHNPIEYASSIQVPVLLMSGADDQKVDPEEIKDIFSMLNGPKSMRMFEDTGHENYLRKNKKEWTTEVSEFLDKNDPAK